MHLGNAKTVMNERGSENCSEKTIEEKLDGNCFAFLSTRARATTESSKQSAILESEILPPERGVRDPMSSDTRKTDALFCSRNTAHCQERPFTLDLNLLNRIPRDVEGHECQAGHTQQRTRDLSNPIAGLVILRRNIA
jgi:hypothetical protein